MNNDDAAGTILLSQEELLFVIKLLNLPVLPAMGNLPLGQVSEEMADLLLDAARRALIARRIIVFDENNTLQIDPGVQAVAFVCAYPDQMLVLAFQRYDDPIKQHFFYRVPELAISHTSPMRGLHSLEIRTTPDMGAATISELLYGLSKDGIPTTRYTLNRSDLARVQELVSQDSEAAVSLLIAVGMPMKQAQAFVQALAKPNLSLILQLMYRVIPAVEQKVLALVADEAGCWLLEDDQLDAYKVTVQGLPAKQAVELILNAHKPFTEPLQAE